jgi:hypothetical protein
MPELNLIIDHVFLSAERLGRARAFYSKALAPIGLEIVREVSAEHNGKPGARPNYHPAYYAAFVLSPEGHNIEAVCFEDE